MNDGKKESIGRDREMEELERDCEQLARLSRLFLQIRSQENRAIVLETCARLIEQERQASGKSGASFE